MDVTDALKEEGIYKFIMDIQDEKERDNLLSKCRIEEFKKGDFIIFPSEEESSAIAFLSGEIKMRIYVGDITDYTVAWDSDMWVGIAQALSLDVGMGEIIFKKDTKVLFFPLKDLLFRNPKENIDLWIKISRMSAKKALEIRRNVIEKGCLPTVAYFLKRLSENGYCFEGLSIPDISQELNINLRTLQRIIKTLEEQGYIERDKSTHTIRSIDDSKVDKYIEEVISE